MARVPPYLLPYDASFLGDGFRVPLPATRCPQRLANGGRPLDYIHYSVVLHAERRSAVFTAHNVDGSRRRSVDRSSSWWLDGRVPSDKQTGASAYAGNDWDRGHLVRRADVAWGDTEQHAREASDSTFFYTNAALQHARFNQDEWLFLEDWVLARAWSGAPRLCVFTGPLYTRVDITSEEGMRVPSAFWKVVVLRDDVSRGTDLAVACFLMKQNELWNDWNGKSSLDLKLYQVGLREVGQAAGVDFGELAQLDDYVWRARRHRNAGLNGWRQVTGPEDITFPGGERRRARGLRSARTVATPPVATPPVATPPGPTPPPEPTADCGCDGTPSTSSEALKALGLQVALLQALVQGLDLEAAAGQDSGRLTRLTALRRTLDRIVGGEPTDFGEFPECVLIGDESGWFCTGVLVRPTVVLTAAHCAERITRVGVGVTNLQLLGLDGEVVPVRRVVVHPDYDTNGLPSHDLAVVMLERPATKAQPVGILPLARVEEVDDVDLVGFGYDHPSQPWGFGVQRKVNVPATPLGSRLGSRLPEAEARFGYGAASEMHAGRKQLGKDSCNGDSGGPCYWRTGDADGTRLVVSVTSRAAADSDTNCGDGGIYTLIAPYGAWLAQVTGDASFRDLTEVAGAGVVAAPAARLFIAAVLPNPVGSDSGTEKVVVGNAGGQAGSLAGLTLVARSGNPFALEGEVAPGGEREFTLPASGPKLSNRGGWLELRRGEWKLDRVSWGAVQPDEWVRYGVADGGTDAAGGGTTADLWQAEPC